MTNREIEELMTFCRARRHRAMQDAENYSSAISFLHGLSCLTEAERAVFLKENPDILADIQAKFAPVQEPSTSSP
jgi:hypothetical protein